MATAVRRYAGAIVSGSLLFGGVTVVSAIGDAAPASAGTPVALYVASGSTGNCTLPAEACGTVQDAIDTAQNGRDGGDDVTIYVGKGTYPEDDTVNASGLHSLTIAGADALTTAVNGGGAGTVLTVDSGTVTVSGLTIENGNGAIEGGGGIYNDGTMAINDSAVSGNNNSGPSFLGGGGILNLGTMTINASTVSGNTSFGFGSGISNVGGLAITDTTISGNTAEQVGSGAIAAFDAVTITDSTISGNTAPAGVGSGIDNTGGEINIGGTIVAGNSGGNCTHPGDDLTSVGYNLTDDESCGLTQSTDITVTPNTVDLGPLADNGGPTESMLPALGSPATGYIASAPSIVLNGVQACPRADQRGVSSYGYCSIGAVEGGFLITTTSLPVATPGSPYRDISLTTQEASGSTSPYLTTLKWKKVALPKGLRLTSTGELTGTPNRHLTPGQSSATVQVTETVTIVVGTKKVKAKETTEATIPLTVS